MSNSSFVKNLQLMMDPAYTPPKPKVPHEVGLQVRCVAIRMRHTDFVITLPRPNRHHNIINTLAIWSDKTVSHHDWEQGFMSADGQFWTREHAARMCGRKGKLFSEDLW